MKVSLGIALLGLVGIGITVSGCGGSSTPHVTTSCVHNSDCANVGTGKLICALGYCVAECVQSSDCPGNERCVIVSKGASDGGVDDAGADASATTDAGAGVSTACQAPETVKCQYTSQCANPLVCSADDQCRDQCHDDRDCTAGQKCTSSSKVCADPLRDSNYNATTNEFNPNDGGAGGGGTGGTGTGGGAGGMSGGNDGGADVASDTSVGDATGPGGHAGATVCTGPELQFGDVAKGDANASFTSGVGTHNADTFFIFSAYHGTLPADGGVDGGGDAAAPVTGSLVYAQEFDMKTGASLGPAAPLFAPVEDGPMFYVEDVAIAPTGELVVIYSHTTVVDTRRDAVFAAFLTATPVADAGAPTLHVVRTVQLESVTSAHPHVIWWDANQTFVTSWKFIGGGGVWQGRIKAFLPSGLPGPGSVGIVPNPTALSDYTRDEAQVGAAGSLMGMVIRNAATATDYLTIMGNDGLQVGNSIELSPVGADWSTVGATKNGFVSFFNSATTIHAIYAPTTGPASILADGGAPDGGAAGVPTPTELFTFGSNIRTGHAISDDVAAGGGVGAGILEDDGAAFVYVTADASKHYTLGTVISSASGAEIAVTNFKGSFGVSLFSNVTGATSVVASSCGL
jgi:hypothetical protein